MYPWLMYGGSVQCVPLADVMIRFVFRLSFDLEGLIDRY